MDLTYALFVIIITTGIDIITIIVKIIIVIMIVIIKEIMIL